MVRLVCGHRGWHRPVIVFCYAGPLPVPAGYQPRGKAATLELKCSHCGYAPRPGDEGLRQAINYASTLPRMILDINPPRPGQ